ncbi:MAG: diguanylate cyclase domain-containing protein, partial [Candidatus Dormibacteria bacterium]
TYESQARFEFEAARGDLDSLATWRPGLRPQLPGLLAGVRQSVFAFAGPINHDVIRAENPRFARSTFSRASARVRESVAGAERNVTALLRSDLETRATRITQTIALIAIATFAAIALAVYLLRALTLVFVRRERHALTVAAAETERSRLAFEHDRAVDAMASTEARFRAIFNGSTVGMAIIDLDGCTLEQNEALSRTFGRFDVRTLGYDERELHAVLSGRCERIVCEVAVGNGRADRRWLSANLSLVRDDDQRARFAMAIFQDVTERRRMDERLQFEARHDALTGLANRAAFVAALDEMLASPAGERGAVLFLDLDKFKLINDVAGHHAGDRVIQRAAHRMRSAVRASDLVARLGGDEFAILIRNIHDRTH